MDLEARLLLSEAETEKLRQEKKTLEVVVHSLEKQLSKMLSKKSNQKDRHVPSRKETAVFSDKDDVEFLDYVTSLRQKTPRPRVTLKPWDPPIPF